MADHVIPETTPNGHGEGHPQGGHEPDWINLRAILTFTVLMVVVVVVSFLVLGALMAYYFQAQDRYRAEAAPSLFADASGQYPGPRLQEAPKRDMAAMRAATRERLSTFGWVDEEQKVAHIPIGRAIRIVADRGLPTREGDSGGELPEEVFSSEGGAPPPMAPEESSEPDPGPAEDEATAPSTP